MGTKAKDLFEEHGEDVVETEAPAENVPVQPDNRPPSQVLLDKVIGGTEGIGSGLAQGATLGYADELGGAMVAGADNLYNKGTIDTPTLNKDYEKYRDLIRNYYATIKKEQPGTTELGEVVGGFAAPLPVGQLNPLLEVAKDSGSLARLTKPLLKYAAVPAAEGSAIGSAAILGQSDIPINTELGRQQNLEKIKEHLPTNAGIGLGVGLVTSIPALAKTTPYGERASDVAKLSRQGKDMSVDKRGADLLATTKCDMRDKGEDFADFLWGINGPALQNRWTLDTGVPAETSKAQEMAKALKAKGFKYCGPVIVYAFMQAVGMVNDHLVTCYRHDECARLSV